MHILVAFPACKEATSDATPGPCPRTEHWMTRQPNVNSSALQWSGGFDMTAINHITELYPLNKLHWRSIFHWWQCGKECISSRNPPRSKDASSRLNRVNRPPRKYKTEVTKHLVVTNTALHYKQKPISDVPQNKKKRPVFLDHSVEDKNKICR